MNAMIIRNNGEEHQVDADWRVVPTSAGWKELLVSAVLPQTLAAGLMVGSEHFILRMNDGREAEMFVSNLHSSSHSSTAPCRLSLSRMIQENPKPKQPRNSALRSITTPESQ